MKPPTPAMIRALRLIESHGQITMYLLRSDTKAALEKRGLIEVTPETRGICYWRYRWQLTDAGRRVLAEQDKP